MAAWSRVAAMAAAVALSGCATPPRPSLPDDTPGSASPALEAASAAARHTGRLGLQVDGAPERSFSADFELSGNAGAGELLLSGPLGAGAARARWSPRAAVLVTAQGESRAEDLRSLAREALGEALPIEALFDWLAGRPWPGATATPLAAPEQGFEQLGWRVDLKRRADGLLVATRPASVDSPQVTVRIRLSESAEAPASAAVVPAVGS